MIHAGYRKLCI